MSKTYIGIVVMLLSEFLPRFGVTIGTEDLTTTVTVIGIIVGALVAFIGRYNAGGIKWFGARKV